MLEKQREVLVDASQSVGRIIFLPDTRQKFLFFIPKNHTPALKLLKSSMWFEITNEKYGKIYRAATSLEALFWLKDTLGQLSLSPEVNEWRKKISQSVSIKPIPHLPLFDFQREAIGFLLTHNRCMLSLSPGLGKTICSITATNLSTRIQRVLVVAPLSLLYMWKSEIIKWEPFLQRKSTINIVHGKKITTEKEANEDNYIAWTITNPETAQKMADPPNRIDYDLLILDESILYKSRNAKRTKGIRKLANKIPKVWELTGAPANRMIDDIWSQFHILNEKAYSSYHRFAQEYCMVNPTTWGNQVIANKLNAEEKIKQRFQDIYFARSQNEVLDIPDWIFEEIDIPMSKRQEKAYHELNLFLYTTLTNELDDGTIVDSTQVTVVNHLAKVVRLIQLASNPMLLDGDNESGKWDALPELMEYYPGPWLIWTSFTRTAYHLQEQLGPLVDNKIGLIIGDTKTQERNQLIEEYQRGDKKILILNMQTGSFGHTLTAARTAFYPERNYDSNYFQSLHRFRRIGTTQSPNVVHLRSVYQDGSPTIDHLIHSLLDYRVGMIQNLTTGMLRGILK